MAWSWSGYAGQVGQCTGKKRFVTSIMCECMCVCVDVCGPPVRCTVYHVRCYICIGWVGGVGGVVHVVIYSFF